MQGTIIKNISNDYTIITNNNKEYICKPRGKFRLNDKIPLVGDKVIFDETNNYILEILPRKNELIRPSIANVDTAIIVTSVKHPDFDTILLDKQLTLISYNNIEPIIYFTKLDLLTNDESEEINKYISYYQNIGYKTATSLKELYPLIDNKIIVLTGQSGAGKSTLLNKIDPSLELNTNEISYALGRGKHTTRHTEFFKYKTSLIADTPGFSKLEFYNMTKMDIRDNMKEMFNNLDKCKYKDCLHEKEDHCHIKNMVNNNEIIKSRYNNYIYFINNINKGAK